MLFFAEFLDLNDCDNHIIVPVGIDPANPSLQYKRLTLEATRNVKMIERRLVPLRPWYAAKLCPYKFVNNLNNGYGNENDIIQSDVIA